MAPWWLRSAEDETPIDAIETNNKATDASNDKAETVATSSTTSEPAVSAESRADGADEPTKSRRRRRRRRSGPRNEAAQPARADVSQPKTANEPPAKATPPAVRKAAVSAADVIEAGSEPEPDDKPRKRRRRRSRRDVSAKPPTQAPTTAAESKPSRDAAPSTAPTPESSPRPQADAPEAAPPTVVQAPPEAPTKAQATVPPPTTVQPQASIATADLAESFGSGVVYIPDRGGNDERKIAMFFDFENIALGVRDTKDMTFDVGLVLARLLEKGKIVVKRAYADWQRYADFKRPLHEAAIEMIDIPKKRYSGKNSADIKMVVDAMDLCYAKDHLDTFVLVSGDSDFSPLVSKLKENDKYVIGLGMKSATSQLLVDNCDEFIYYEDVWRDAQRAPRLDHVDTEKSEVFQLMVDAMQALVRENKEVLWGSMIKQTMKRKRPSFNEGYYGYSTFSELLEDAQKKDLIRLRRDQRSGGYIVTDFASQTSADS